MKKYTSPIIEQVALHTTDIVTFSVTTSSGGDVYSWGNTVKSSSPELEDGFF